MKISLQKQILKLDNPDISAKDRNAILSEINHRVGYIWKSLMEDKDWPRKISADLKKSIGELEIEDKKEKKKRAKMVTEIEEKLTKDEMDCVIIN